MQTINFKIQNRIIERTDTNKLIGMVGQDKVSVEFVDEEWTDLHKTLKLIRSDGAIVYLAITNDEVELTQECYVEGNALLGFFGTINENEPEEMEIASTDYITIYFTKHAYSTEEGEAINQPTPTQWDIIVGQMNDIKEHIDEQAQYIEELIEHSDFNPDTLKIDYISITSKPKINGVELVGDKTSSDLNINIPAKTSELQNDSGFINNESDPTVPEHVKNITQQNISDWNNKSNFSGNYNDLSNKPTIPTKTSDLTNDSNYLIPTNIKAGTNVTVSVNGKDVTINSTGGGTTDYSELTNKPSINGVTLSGNKTTADLNISIPEKTSELINDSGFLTQHQDISGKEDKTNKVTSISANSTNEQYPSAKAVYDYINTNITSAIGGAY